MNGATQVNGAPRIPAELVQSQLQKILISSTFIHSERLRRFLRFCVEQATQGKPENLREYALAMEVFDRPDSYSPASDPIVRVEARRLRAKLQQYYDTEGCHDLLIIDVPKGSYLPSFELRQPVAAPAWWRKHWPLATLLTGILAMGIWWIARPAAAPKFVFSRVTSDSGLTIDAAISPDGSLLAYASDRGRKGDLDIWVQQVAGGQPIPLTREPADDHQPSFSRDGTAVVFRSEGDPAGIYTVPALGGERHFITPDGRDPRFSPDGRSIAYWIGSPGDDFLPPAGKIYVVGASGGAPRQLAPNFTSAAFPIWSPDGSRLLFEGTQDYPPDRKFDWWILSIADGKVVKTGGFEALARNDLRMHPQRPVPAWVGNQLIFSATSGDSTNLWQLPLSGGKPQRLTLGSAVETEPSLASNGTIAFSSLFETVDVWSLNLGGDPAEPSSAMKRITDTAARSIFPSVSADGTKLAYLSNKAHGSGVWVKDLKTGRETALPTEAARYSMISRDGETVAFSQGPAILVMPSNGGDATRVCSDCGRVWDWSPDGTRILFVAPGTPTGVGELTLSSRARRVLLTDPRHDLASPQYSPDGRWISFHAILGPTQRQIYIARYDSPTDSGPVTDGAALDRDAVWSPDGSSLYYLSERDGFRCIWRQALDSSKMPKGLAAPVAHFHSASSSLLQLGDVGAIGLAAAPGKLLFSLGELRGNIWIARPEPRP